MPTIQGSGSPARPSSKRKIALIICAVLLVATAVLTAIRWNAWFGNKPEGVYHTPDSIDRITLVAGADFVHERTISWRCGERLQNAYIEYGIAGEDSSILQPRRVPARGQDIASRSGHGCYYQVHLSQLVEGQSYRYRLHTGEQSSRYYTFGIPQSSSETSFLYLGDVQDPDGRMSDSLLAKLPALSLRTDFLAVAGDQIEGPANEYWDVWYKSLGQWSPELCIVAATGNHEYLKKGLMRELDPRWVPQYGFPTNGPEDFEGRSYYIDFPLMRYIVMDSNGINAPTDVYRHREWLRTALRGSRQPWQVVMFHHGIYSVREGRSNPVMRYAFRPILEEEGADLVLQGHDHSYSRINTRDAEGKKSTPMYIISSSSPKTYRNGFDEIHDRLGSGLQLYQHIRITRDTIHYRSYQYSGKLYDDVEICKQPSGDAVLVKDHAEQIPEEFLFDAFGSDAKGEKKAAKYRQAVQEYLQRKQNTQR